MNPDDECDHTFFEQNGYFSLGQVLSGPQLAAVRQSFDRTRQEYRQFWYPNGIYQSWHLDASC